MQITSNGANINEASQKNPSSANSPQPAQSPAPASTPIATNSGSAVELDSLRLRLVEELAKLLAQLDGQDTTLASELLALRASLGQSRSGDSSTTQAMLQLMEQLGAIVNDPHQSTETQELLRQLAILSGTSSSATSELLARLAHNDFSGIDILLADLRTALEDTSKSTTAQSLQPLLAALRELSTLGTPEALPTAMLAKIEALVIPKTAVPLDPATVQALQKNYAPPVLYNNTPATLYSAQDVPLLFRATVSQNTSTSVELDGKVSVPWSAQNTTAEVPAVGTTLTFSLEKSGERTWLQPWPATAQLPASEQEYWQASGLPPTSNTVAVRDFLTQYGALPADPAVAGQFGQALHQLSLQMPGGAEPTSAQKDLLLRAVLLSQGEPLGSAALQSLARYQENADPEGELFQRLPTEIREQVLRELPVGTKTMSPEALQAAVEKTLEHIRTQQQGSDTQQTLQQLKEQLQWTRLDQETRHPADREQVFYWQHNGEMQKGRLRVRDERNEQNRQNHTGAKRSYSFSVEAKIGTLGKVQADLKLQGDRLDVRIADEKGTAQEAIQAERQSLVQELADMGLDLGELLYGALRLRNESVKRPNLGNGSANSRLDVVG